MVNDRAAGRWFAALGSYEVGKSKMMLLQVGNGVLTPKNKSCMEARRPPNGSLHGFDFFTPPTRDDSSVVQVEA